MREKLLRTLEGFCKKGKCMMGVENGVEVGGRKREPLIFKVMNITESERETERDTFNRLSKVRFTDLLPGVHPMCFLYKFFPVPTTRQRCHFDNFFFLK